MTQEQLIINRIKEHDDEALRQVYNTHKQGFIDFSVRFGLGHDDVLDVYQDTVVAFCENARKGHLDELQSMISTYIFAVGKYKIYARLKKNRREIPLQELPKELSGHGIEEDEQDERIPLLRQAFLALGDKCREVLTLFYYEQKKLDEIQKLMGYENKDVLKSQKSRCLRQLKESLSKK
ncbi:RNA polymerase sigma factor (sigma-70 family) [Algoriphagus sp. 4150]|uniref:RNA polymerase sigma factor n=1 Tax=Algoriphagus sp. 4150 TaxID=2817756 RepID=UPI00285C9DDF|nr:sigma-70 family RNA polymerase sigma factor [Algoriphagus sp. 4150]MDR7129776.1 RNA polymerase sigma factor (sigma-70 family) [Algoriphagus sp. 4150]